METIHIDDEPPTRIAINNPQRAAKVPTQDREKPTKRGKKNPHGVEANGGGRRHGRTIARGANRAPQAKERFFSLGFCFFAQTQT